MGACYTVWAKIGADPLNPLTTNLNTGWVYNTTQGVAGNATVSLYEDCGQVYRIEVDIVSWDMVGDTHYIAPTIVMTNTVEIFNGVKVGVTIRNDTTQPITNVHGMVWNNGDFEGFYPEPVTNYLAPGVTMTFTDTISTITGPGGFSEPIWIAVQGITEP